MKTLRGDDKNFRSESYGMRAWPQESLSGPSRPVESCLWPFAGRLVRICKQLVISQKTAVLRLHQFLLLWPRVLRWVPKQIANLCVDENVVCGECVRVLCGPFTSVQHLAYSEPRTSACVDELCSFTLTNFFAIVTTQRGGSRTPLSGRYLY